MIVEPPQKDLVWGQTKQVVDCLALFAKSKEFGVKLDIHLRQQSSADNLPDQTENEMLATLGDVG
jgi:hypothetical protein